MNRTEDDGEDFLKAFAGFGCIAIMLNFVFIIGILLVVKWLFF